MLCFKTAQVKYNLAARENTEIFRKEITMGGEISYVNKNFCVNSVPALTAIPIHKYYPHSGFLSFFLSICSDDGYATLLHTEEKMS